MPVSVMGWLGLASSIRGHKLVELPGYQRPPVNLAGEDVLPRVHRIGGPPGSEIRFAGLFDAPSRLSGRLLIYWKTVPPYSVVPGSFRGEEIRTIWTTPVQQLINRSLLDEIDDTVPIGAELGLLNGQVITAATKLAFVGGVLMSTQAADSNRAASAQTEVAT
jgi:hypothetical protein